MIKLPRQNLKMKIKKKPGTLKREILDTKTTKSRQYLGEIKLRVKLLTNSTREVEREKRLCHREQKNNVWKYANI